jgi:hypothetical protein
LLAKPANASMSSSKPCFGGSQTRTCASSAVCLSSLGALELQRSRSKTLTALVLEGHLSPRALGLVVEWAAAHRQELIEDWHLARQQQPLKRIAPLE